ncbi:isoleucine--tRNA ligase [Isoalcanivorax beigongshangi]|uniref:Isoleucine--tRNA ligase n=1 Tax=Isoalcanivorax beigongshangi TaxID=3238810 RepID=A0ABV4AJX3_9GAMM
MTDYKATLNLPETAFPMKAGLAQREPEQLAAWTRDGLYEAIRARFADRPKYILHDGPPYANGAIHIGHALNKIIKDIILKSRTLSGFDTPYTPGWDCHGLPIEHKVEQLVGKPGQKVDAAAFRAKCREYAAGQIDAQRDGFIRLGVFGDWQRPYLTMNFDTEANIIRAFGKIVENGYLQKGFKPVQWCLDCGSALAEAEVEYQDKRSHSIDVAFAVADVADFNARTGLAATAPQVVIWTTTPWTLPANRAVALHPELEYVLLSGRNAGGLQQLVVAEALAESVAVRLGLEQVERSDVFLGQALENLVLRHPFMGTEVPVILGDHVTTDAGTGCVHTAPGHGLEDFIAGQQYGLETDSPLLDSGLFAEGTPVVGGMHVTKANEPVIEALRASGQLMAAGHIDHSYPHCWRHKTPLIYRATAQWFISMERHNLQQRASEAVEQVQWLPEWGKARIGSMVKDRPDWCISRQRTWGVPIALFVDRETSEPHPHTPALIEAVAAIVEREGVEGWFSLDGAQFLAEQGFAADAERYQKVVDTLDVWFDSGVTHFAVLQKQLGLALPADMYLEGSDQHRGWFQSSLLTSLCINDAPPYRSVLTHGFTVDESGRKMSKSLGNTIEPHEVVNTLGADILRLWVSSTDYRGEMSVSHNILKQMGDAYRRIRNTARFLLANLSGFDPATNALAPEQMLALDRWAVDRAAAVQEEILTAFDDFQFHQVYQRIHHFCSVDLGSFYLDIIKDRQYTTQADSIARRSCQTALYHISEALVRWMAPILSFTAEEIWRYLPGERGSSVFLETWYAGLFRLPQDAELDADFWSEVQDIKQAVNKAIEDARNAKVVRANLAADVTLYVSPEREATLARLGDELRFVTITSTAVLAPLAQAPAEVAPCALTGLTVAVAASPHAKCARCWHHREDVGQHSEYPELCGRCIDNIEGSGEERRYA